LEKSQRCDLGVLNDPGAAFRTRARPANTLPGSTVPPGTRRTDSQLPESLQEIGERLAGAGAAISQTQEASARVNAEARRNFL